MGIRVENSAKKRANRVFSLPSGLPYDPTITMNRTHSLPVSPNGPHTPFEGKSALERHMGRTAQPNRVRSTPRTESDPSVRPPAADSHRGGLHGDGREKTAPETNRPRYRPKRPSDGFGRRLPSLPTYPTLPRYRQRATRPPSAPQRIRMRAHFQPPAARGTPTPSRDLRYYPSRK